MITLGKFIHNSQATKYMHRSWLHVVMNKTHKQKDRQERTTHGVEDYKQHPMYVSDLDTC